MNIVHLRYLGAAFLSASALCYVSAHAALVPTGVACDGHSTSMTSQPGYVDCSGAWSGNNLNQGAAVASQIFSDWGLISLAPQDITEGNSGSSGTLNIATQSGLFVISSRRGMPSACMSSTDCWWPVAFRQSTSTRWGLDSSQAEARSILVKISHMQTCTASRLDHQKYQNPKPMR